MTLEHYEKFGAVSWSSILGMKIVTVVGPEACQTVLVNKDKKFSQNGWEWFIGPFFKRGLMLLDGDEHHYHRRIMQEAFTRPRLESYVDQLTAIIDETVPQWPSDEEFLLYPALKDLTLEVATAVFMGAARDAEDEETRTKVATAFVDCVRAGWRWCASRCRGCAGTAGCRAARCSRSTSAPASPPSAPATTRTCSRRCATSRPTTDTRSPTRTSSAT